MHEQEIGGIFFLANHLDDPSRGRAAAARKQHRRNATMGKIIFSLFVTSLGSSIRIKRSFLDVKRYMIGGWITGTSAMYEKTASSLEIISVLMLWLQYKPF